MIEKRRIFEGIEHIDDDFKSQKYRKSGQVN